MPKCLHCGNTNSFAASKWESVAPYANGPVSGIMADFKGEQLLSIQSIINDRTAIAKATKNPQEYFDTCMMCGGMDIDWQLIK